MWVHFLTNAHQFRRVLGYLLAFSTFLRIRTEHDFKTTDSQAVLILDLVDEISDHFFKVFGSSAEGWLMFSVKIWKLCHLTLNWCSGECPSLEQMENSILAECSDGAEFLTDSDDLTTEKQLILACCWLNIKALYYLISFFSVKNEKLCF